MARIVEGIDEWPMNTIREVHVFGSFARGAVHPNDVDLDIEFDRDDRWKSTFIRALRHGRDPFVEFRRPIVGRGRGVQLAFDQFAEADFAMTLLWRRGDDLETALARLRAIKIDPTASRAERHAALPQFVGLDRWLPRYIREHFVAAVDAGAIAIERWTLPDAEVTNPIAREHLQQRWSTTSPLYRAGRAVFANLIGRGVDPEHVHLHGRRVGLTETPYFAGFSLRYLGGMRNCLIEQGGQEWIEVVHPTAQGALDALRIRPVSATRLARLNWLRD